MFFAQICVCTDNGYVNYIGVLVFDIEIGIKCVLLVLLIIDFLISQVLVTELWSSVMDKVFQIEGESRARILGKASFSFSKPTSPLPSYSNVEKLLS